MNEPLNPEDAAKLYGSRFLTEDAPDKEFPASGMSALDAMRLVDEELVLYRTGHGNLSKRLADRVATADAIMTRALDRRGLADELPRELVGEGYASVCVWLWTTPLTSRPRDSASRSARRWSFGSIVHTRLDAAALRHG